VEGDAPTHAPAPTFRTEKPTVRFLLEGLLIVVSVALGFAVAQYGESRANQELADRVLKGLRAEVERNLATLEPQVAMHRKWLQALAKVAPSNGSETARDVFLATWPDFNPNDIRTPFGTGNEPSCGTLVKNPREEPS